MLLETLGRLGRANVALESCSERLDHATPQGRLFMVLMGGIAQWYCDNLCPETKKGKRERRAQGMYNGLVPFGTTAGPDGVPVEDRRAFCVLSWAERDGRRVVDGVARPATSTACGWRSAWSRTAPAMVPSCTRSTRPAIGPPGNGGANPFNKDTMAEVLTNRFYWGELPLFQDVADENGRASKVQVGWVPAKHTALEGFDDAPGASGASRAHPPIVGVGRQARGAGVHRRTRPVAAADH